MELLKDLESSNGNGDFDKFLAEPMQNSIPSNADTDGIIFFLAGLSEVANNVESCNNNFFKAATNSEATNDVSQDLFATRLRNSLRLKLLINADEKMGSETQEKNTSWQSDAPEDSSPCSPVSAISGSSSTTSADDSGFSSDENRSSEKQHKLARAKSLRSALRSPAHVGQRKTVRFADSLGLDLEQKTYFESDDYKDNEFRSFKSPFSFTQNRINLHSKLVSLNPVNISNRSEAEISHLTRTQCVCLNSINITDTNLSGVVHVLNLACDKQVYIRYTSDGWLSFSETRAIFTRSVGSDGAVDSFSFFIALPSDIPVGATCEFCIRYCVSNNSYWDNNNDQNYKLQCVEEKNEDKLTNRRAQNSFSRNPWESRNNYGSYVKSVLDYDDDDDDDDDEDYYYYTPSYNLHSSKKGYFEQRYGCSYGEHLHFF